MDRNEALPTEAGRSRRLATAGLALLLVLPAAGRAQDIELSGSTGWRFGGSGRSRFDFRELDLDGARSIGGAALVPMWGRAAIGLYYSRATAAARAVLDDEPLDVTVSYLLIGIVYDLRTRGVLRPFIGFSLGSAWQTEAPGRTRSHLTGAAVAGIRVFPTRRLGVRADARLLLPSDDRRTRRTRPFVRGASLTLTGDSVVQAELAIALVVAF